MPIHVTLAAFMTIVIDLQLLYVLYDTKFWRGKSWRIWQLEEIRQNFLAQNFLPKSKMYSVYN